MKRIYISAIAAILCASSWNLCGHAAPFSAPKGSAVNGDNPVGRAFKNRASNVQVEGEGLVTRVLPDDLAGGKHQRFIVRLASGQTVLIAHNIDIAPRVAGLQKNDGIRFYGEYVWNEKGGLVHWTHHDPQGRHTAGWLQHGGRIYQ
jgi:hypothetical protein